MVFPGVQGPPHLKENCLQHVPKCTTENEELGDKAGATNSGAQRAQHVTSVSEAARCKSREGGETTWRPYSPPKQGDPTHLETFTILSNKDRRYSGPVYCCH